MNEQSKALQHWGDQAMYPAEEMPQGINVFLLSATPDPLGAVAAMCSMYEGKVVRDLCEVTDDGRRHYWEQVQKTHLKAPLEAIDLHFMVEGITRAITHQMVRQRTAVFAQESLRFAVKENLADEIEFPIGIGDTPGDLHIIWEKAIEQVVNAYEELINRGMPAEAARGLLPHAVPTRLNYKTNLRNLVEHAGNRLCTQAQFDWRLLLSRMVHEIRFYDRGFYNLRNEYTTYRSDWQFMAIADSGMFKPVCFEKGKCPFQADFDRGCTIRERADSGRFDEIKDEEWLLDPAAARL